MMMEAVSCSEKSLSIYQTTRCYTPKTAIFILRKTFGFKKAGVTEQFKMISSEELDDVIQATSYR
jgi:hypothetical protein